jgi:hypothetical protein
MYTDCGLKNSNTIIYIGIILAVLNTYFGLLYRLITYCYSLKRLNAYKRKIEVNVTNLQLSQFGFRHIRDKLKFNKMSQSLEFTGENYEYMVLNEKSVKKFTKLAEIFPVKEKMEFVDINKVKLDSVRQAKSLFLAIDNNLKNLRYLTIQ